MKDKILSEVWKQVKKHVNITKSSGVIGLDSGMPLISTDDGILSPKSSLRKLRAEEENGQQQTWNH